MASPSAVAGSAEICAQQKGQRFHEFALFRPFNLLIGR